MAIITRTTNSTSGVGLGEAVTETAAPNATGVRAENQAKGMVRITGEYKISKSILGVLEKFATKMKTPIVVVFFNYDSYPIHCHRPISKDEMMLFCPVNIDDFDNSYPVRLKDLGAPTTATNGASGSIECRFLPDRYAQSVLMNTPFVPLYADAGMDIHVGFAIKNEIVFHADFMSDKSVINDFLNKSLLLSALKCYETMDKEGMLSKRAPFDRRILDNYIRFIKNLQNNCKHTLRVQMNDLSEEISGHYRALQNLEKKMQDAATLSASITKRITKNKHDTDPICVEKMIEPLLTNNKYKTFEFSSDGQFITAYTNLIEIERLGKKYKIGEFRVIVKLDGVVTMENLTNCYSDGGSRYDHPHVHDKFPCLGNIKEQVTTMIRNFNFLPLFDLLHTYLCTYMNEENARPFMLISKWSGLTQEQWCNTCDRPKCDCICSINRCNSCSHPIDDCTCSRCPASNILMDDVICDDCEHQNDDGDCGF